MAIRTPARGPLLQGLRGHWEAARASYWFLPSLMTLGAMGLASLTLAVDEGTQVEWVRGLGWLYTRGPEGARGILSTVAGSMITVAGVVFSVTIVALSLASNQFGPRLLRNFMRDTGNQVVLGTFVATFVYCLLVLRTVRGIEGQEFVPHLSVSTAVLLALASLGVLIYFVHHAAMSIQAPEVIARVSEELHEVIDRLFPEPVGDGSDDGDGGEGTAGLPARFDEYARPVPALAGGYVQEILPDRLLAAARDHDLVIRLACRPGQFVVAGTPLAHAGPRVLPPGAAQGAGPGGGRGGGPGGRAGEAGEAIREAFVLGSRRTPAQDVGFAFEQLVEVATRALSPGVNDPFTARSCIDRLGAGLGRLAGRRWPSPDRRDAAGELRVVALPLAFRDVLEAALAPLRRCGSGDPAVMVGLLAALEAAAARARRPDDLRAVEQQARLVLGAAERGVAEEADRNAVRERFAAVRGTARTGGA